MIDANVLFLHLLFNCTKLYTSTLGLTVALFLPSCATLSTFPVCVSAGGLFFQLNVSWPSSSIDLKYLHRKWLSSKGTVRIKMYHSKVIGFEHFLVLCWAIRTDCVETTSRIDFPFQEQTCIFEKYNLGLSDTSAKVIFVELCGT